MKIRVKFKRNQMSKQNGIRCQKFAVGLSKKVDRQLNQNGIYRMFNKLF